jgi:hypothetical protein
MASEATPKFDPEYDRLNADAKRKVAELVGSVAGVNGARIMRRDGGSLTVTKSSREGEFLQVTRFDEGGEPTGDRAYTKERRREILDDPDLLDAAKWALRPDLVEGAHLDVLEEPGAWLYRLKYREHGPGTSPSDGLLSAKGQNVAYHRPLTYEELRVNEMQPMGAMGLKPEAKPDLTKAEAYDLNMAEITQAIQQQRWPLTKEAEQSFLPTDPEYPLAGQVVDGRSVGCRVDNTSSISSSFTEYEVLKGIREVPLSDFRSAPLQLFCAADDIRRCEDLAERIRQSEEISPLIVAVDRKGPYILEGAHRLGALHLLKAKTFPAMVVMDLDVDVSAPVERSIADDRHQALTSAAEASHAAPVLPSLSR